MNTQKIILIIAGVVVVAGGVFLALKQPRMVADKPLITNFEECVKAGYPVMESYPEQCRTPDGQNFVHQVTPVNPPNPSPQIEAQFNQPVTLSLNKKVTFSDGLVVILTEINDSRCPKDVQCIWAGEISAALELSLGKISKPGEIHLGTVMNKSSTAEDYTFTLKSADTKSVTIVVEYKKS